MLRSVELFAGAGGLGMGVAMAGFKHDLVVEWNHKACETIRENQRRGVELVSTWPLQEGDIRQLDFSLLPSGLELLSGGPPCQGWSLGGKHRGWQDDRNLFPEAVRAVRDLQPRVFMFENVKGLLRPSFAKYYQYVILQLTYPELLQCKNEDWSDHLKRLELIHAGGPYPGLRYRVDYRLLNAANYGVPQRRERVIIVGVRADLGVDWSFPDPTHSRDSLLWSQWVTGDYWERHGVAKKHRPKLPRRFQARVDKLWENALAGPSELPWRTVRDGLEGLPDPVTSPAARKFLNHVHNPGARSYPGHTGSPLDEPAKTLKAGDHGVPGGENMLALPDGSIRYLTVRESARLQGFPDDYFFPGCWGDAMRQLGNAVPVGLSHAMAREIRSQIFSPMLAGMMAR